MVNTKRLTEQKAYTVYASVDEWSSTEQGIYSTYGAANIKASKAGWYGSDGEVRDKTVWSDPNGELYELKPIGRFIDVTELEKEKLLSEIKQKLTQAEQKFLNILPLST